MTGHLFEKFLNDAVLKAVEGNNNQPGTRRKNGGRLFEKLPQIIEFIINGDSQRLKRSGGRVYRRFF